MKNENEKTPFQRCISDIQRILKSSWETSSGIYVAEMLINSYVIEMNLFHKLNRIGKYTIYPIWAIIITIFYSLTIVIASIAMVLSEIVIHVSAIVQRFILWIFKKTEK